jgi:hypothetical protein
MAKKRTETNRVQRWREGKRRQGLKAITIWVSPDEELHLKDLALQWHCSPSAVMQQALSQVSMSLPQRNGSHTDTLQMRELIQEQLATLQAQIVAIQAVQGTVTETVTETVTDKLARDLPALVRQLVEGLALEALGLPVTDTNGSVTVTGPLDLPITDTPYGNVTDIEIPEQVEEAPPRRKGGRPWSAMGQRIVALLGEHPEGLSAEQIRAFLQPEKPLGDTLQSLRKREKVKTRGAGKDLRYFVA